MLLMGFIYGVEYFLGNMPETYFPTSWLRQRSATRSATFSLGAESALPELFKELCRKPIPLHPGLGSSLVIFTILLAVSGNK